MRFSSLKTKLVLATCVICLFCLFMVCTVSYIISYNEVKEAINQKAAESVMKTASEFNTWFVEQGQAVTGIVEDIEINNDFGDQYLLSYLTSKLKRQSSPVIDYYMGFPTQDKTFIDGSGWQPPPEFDCTTRKWYTGAVQNDNLAYTTPYLDASTGQMIFTIARPVKQKGQFTGVVGADILLTDLINRVQKSKTDEAEYAFLVDSERNFLVHPEKGFQPTPTGLQNAANVLDGRYLPMLDQILKGQYGIIELKDYDGIDKYFVTSPIKSTNWTFGVAIPKAEYMKPLNKLLYGFIAALAISLAVGILIILLLVNSLLKPIGKLREAVTRYSQKDFTTRSPVTTRDEVGDLSKSFNSMADIIEDYSHTLEQRVEERTLELREANERVMQSIDYAQRIQTSILPNMGKILEIPADNYFIIWKPRDLVGGDFYWCKKEASAYYIAVADCTGHGVPGALMTMTVNAILDRIMDHAGDYSPATVLKKLNRLLKETLNQDNSNTLSNDGVDIGLCLVKPDEKKLFYAGARIALLYCRDNVVVEVKGDRQSLGYKKSDPDYEFSNYELNLEGVTNFYLSTDGIFDQNGQENEFGFGSKRFQNIIGENQHMTLASQEKLVLDILQN
ncbi:MAG: cache domain-containing protein, partial [Syntrophomonas sp.]|nr:cache domain-containing protein [Syntrophomonas sp.]